MKQLGILMDPIESIRIHKDSSFAMLLEAQCRGWSIHYMTLQDLRLENNQVTATTTILSVCDDENHWHHFGAQQELPLSQLDIILMRKDPPFDIDYLYATYLLELAAQQGTWIINRPDSLRNCNEKLFTTWFPQCCPPTLVSRNPKDFSRFLGSHGHIVIKPLNSMGGHGVFSVKTGESNRNVIFETLTHSGQTFATAQKYLPEIQQGDKRILMIHAKPVPYALARIPDADDGRGNLAAGAYPTGVELSKRDRWICQQVAPVLKQRGLDFVGLDVIGDWLTEINVTSPTCIRELDSICDLNISALLFDYIEDTLGI